MQVVDLGRYGTMEFPDEYTPDQMEAAILAKHSPPSGLARRYIADPLLRGASGVVGYTEGLVGLADIPTFGLVGKALEAGVGYDPKFTREYFRSLRSPESRAAEERFAAAEGILGKAGQAIREPGLIVGTAIESLPAMFGGGAIGRGGLALRGLAKTATTAQKITAAAVGEGLMAAGMTAEQIRQESESGFLTPKQVGLALSTGASTGLLGRLGGKVAEELKLVDPDVLFTAAGGAANVARRNIASRIIGGMAAEGFLEELPQSVSEQIQMNFATGKRWDEGVADNAVIGTLSGALMGGLANVRGGLRAEKEPEPPVQEGPAMMTEAERRAIQRGRGGRPPGAPPWPFTPPPPGPPVAGAPAGAMPPVQGPELPGPRMPTEAGAPSPAPTPTPTPTPTAAPVIAGMPTGDIPIKVRRADGTEYDAGFNGWQPTKVGGEPGGTPVYSDYVPVLSKPTPAGGPWTTGARLEPGETIVGALPLAPGPVAQYLGPEATTAKPSPGAPQTATPAQLTPLGIQYVRNTLERKQDLIRTGKWPSGQNLTPDEVRVTKSEIDQLNSLLARSSPAAPAPSIPPPRGRWQDIPEFAMLPQRLQAKLLDPRSKPEDFNEDEKLDANAWLQEASPFWPQAEAPAAPAAAPAVTPPPVVTRQAPPPPAVTAPGVVTETTSTPPSFKAAGGDVTPQIVKGPGGIEGVWDVILQGSGTRRVRRTEIVSRPKLMQFRVARDLRTGETEQGRIEGKWSEFFANQLLLWEPKPENRALYGLTGDERYIVANGHSRFAKMQRDKVESVNAQVVTEAEGGEFGGFTAAAARRLGAQMNIVDGKGTIYDQVKYLRDTEAALGADEEVGTRERLGSQGRQAATIAFDATDQIYIPWLNGQLSTAYAEAIAGAAPKDPVAQARGLALARRRLKPDVVAAMMKLQQARERGPGPTAEQAELFGKLFGQAGEERNEALANALVKIKAEISRRIRSVENASRFPEQARAMGLPVDNEELLQENLDAERALLERWNGDFYLDPELLAELNRVADEGTLRETPPEPEVIGEQEELVAPAETPQINAAQMKRDILAKGPNFDVKYGRKKLSKDDKKKLAAYLDEKIAEWAAKYTASPTLVNLLPLAVYHRLKHGGKQAESYFAYITQFNGLMEELPGMAILNLATATSDDYDDLWTDYRDQYEEAEQPDTFNARLNMLRQALDVGEKVKQIPAAMRPDKKQFTTEKLTPGEFTPPNLQTGAPMQQLFDLIRTQKGRVEITRNAKDAGDFAEILAYSGLRAAELFDLKWSDVDLANGTMRIRKPRKQAQVTKRPYDFVMPLALRNFLTQLQAQNPTQNQGDAPVVRFMYDGKGEPGYKKREQAFNDYHSGPAGVTQDIYQAKVTTKGFRHYWTWLGTHLGVDESWMAAMHGRKPIRKPGLGRQEKYKQYQGTPEQSRAEAAKFRFETAAEQQQAPVQQPPRQPPPPAAPQAPPPAPAPSAPPPAQQPAAALAPDLAEAAQQEAQQQSDEPRAALPAAGATVRPLRPDQALTAAEVQEQVDEVDQGTFPVRLLTRAQANALVGEHGDTWYAYFHNGTIHLIPENIPRDKPGKVAELLRHESAHALLQTPAGRQVMRAAMAGALKLTQAELDMVLGFGPNQRGYGLTAEQREAARQGGMTDAEIDAALRDRAMDEFFAIARERNQSLWQRIVEAVKVWLAQNFGLQLSNEETARAMLRAIESNLAKARRAEAAAVLAGAMNETFFGAADRSPVAAAPVPGGPTHHNIAGKTYLVPSTDNMTQADLAAARVRVQQFMQTLGPNNTPFPGQADNSPRGKIGPRTGNKDPNYIWLVVPNGFNYDAEVNAKLLPEIRKAIIDAHTTGSREAAAYASEWINMVAHNFRSMPNNDGLSGQWGDTVDEKGEVVKGVVSPEVLNELMSLTRGEARERGILLNALKGVEDDPVAVARNPDFHLRKFWAESLPTAEILEVVKRVLKEFRGYFTEEELNKFETRAGMSLNQEALDELNGLITRLSSLNRKEAGDRVYRMAMQLYKPKFAKRRAVMEQDARVQEAVRDIVETLKGQISPIPSVKPTKLSPLQALLLHIEASEDKPSEQQKIEMAIRAAVEKGELDAGKDYILNQITDTEERDAVKEALEDGSRVPTESEIEAGLNYPKYVWVRMLRDSFLGYSPVTVKLGEDIINQYFSGVVRTGPYGQARPPLPDDKRADLTKPPAEAVQEGFRINLNELAKKPEEYVQKIWDEIMKQRIARGMKTALDPEADPETKARFHQNEYRIGVMLLEEFKKQVQAAQQRFLTSFVMPPVPKPGITPSGKMAQLLNAQLAKQNPEFWQRPAVTALLKRIARKFADPEALEQVAGNNNADDKVQQIERWKNEILQSANIDLLQEDEAFRVFAEQVVTNDLTERLQAAELKIVNRILNSPDVPYPFPMDPNDYIEHMQKVVTRLHQRQDDLRRALQAGLVANEERIAGAVRKSVVQKNLPSVHEMIRQAMSLPITEHKSIARNFAEQLVRDLGLDPSIEEAAMDLVERAYGNRFTNARILALDRALQSLKPKQSKPIKRKLWETIQTIVKGGGMDYSYMLEEIAEANGWRRLTEEDRARFINLVTRLDELTHLTKQEREKLKAEFEAMTPAEQMEKGELGDVDRYLEWKEVEKFGTFSGEVTRIKKEIETRWARMVAPIDIRTREGFRNFASAASEMSAANLLLRVSFPFRQLFDIFTQFFLHAPTRAIATALEKYHEDRKIRTTWLGEERGEQPTQFWQDFNNALRGSFQQQFGRWRETLSTTLATLKGTPDARNVERLQSGIAAFDRAEQYADELAAKGRNLEASVQRLLGVMRWGFRVAGAFDAVHGVPAQYEEMWLSAYNHLLDNGASRAEARQKADDVMGDVKVEWALAMTAAKKWLEDAGRTPSPTDIRASAANIVKARAYARMAAQGMPADAFQEQHDLLRNTIGWNEREQGGLGGAVAQVSSNMREWLVDLANTPFGILSPLASIFNFGNAIGTSINRAMTFMGLGLFPQAFGVRERDIDQTTGIATKGSPWYRTERDRHQRKVEAMIGLTVGPTLFALAAFTGLVKVRLRWPEDKEEREMLQARGHQIGTVEFWSDDGQSFIPFSLTTGPFALVRPWLASGGAVKDLMETRAKQQAKINEEAARRGLTPVQLPPPTTADYLGVAWEAAQSAIMGGRTAAGLTSALSDYGVPNAKRSVAGAVSAYVPTLPAIQEISRMAGVRMDAKLASVADFMLPLPTSQAAAVNMLGDKVGTRADIQRITQILTGGTFPGAVDSKAAESLPAYKTLFETGYRPPSISSTQGYQFGNDFRVLTNRELAKYTQLRGQYFKEELIGLGEGATEAMARAALQSADRRALAQLGAQRPARAGGSGGGTPISVLSGGDGLGGRLPSAIGSSRLGSSSSGRLRRALGGGRTRTVRLPRPRAARLTRTRIRRSRSLARRQRRTSTRLRRSMYA